MHKRSSQTNGIAKSVHAGARRRGKRSFLFPMGPVPFCIVCVLLIGVMAVFYLGQAARALTANHQLQVIHDEAATLTRQNQDLADTVATEQSPAYIAEHAQKMGLGPIDNTKLWILHVSDLQDK